MNYELTVDGLVTSDPVIASMFLEKRVKYHEGDFWDECTLERVESREFRVICDGYIRVPYEILIPYPLVREAIQPVEGDMLFTWQEENVYPTYWPVRVHGEENSVRACALTVNLTVDELRELVAKCEEAV